MRALQIHHASVAKKRYIEPPPEALDPSDVSGLVMWLRASDLALSDGANADGVWQDQSGENNDMTLAGGPTYQTGEINGLPVVHFDNSNDYGDSSLNLVKPYTIFIVERAVSSDYNRTLNSNSGNCLIANGRDGLVALAGSNASPGTAFAGQSVIGCLVAPASGNAHYYKNREDITSGGGATAVDWGLVTLGYNGTFDEPANTDLAELFIFDRELTSDEFIGLHITLEAKYDIDPFIP